MTFKELVQKDIKRTFLNPLEFGEQHVVNGVNMEVVIEKYEQAMKANRVSQHMDGIYKNRKLVYVAESDFGSLPAQGSKLTMDGKLYIVSDAVSEAGIYLITIEANKGMGR